MMIKYGAPVIEEDDIASVIAVLKTEWLTTGSLVSKFENAFSDFILNMIPDNLTALHSVAVNSGTAALHAAFRCLKPPVSSSFIAPSLTFSATVNAGIYEGLVPVFCDINPETWTIDLNHAEYLAQCNNCSITVGVDYAGLPVDMPSFKNKCANIGKDMMTISDACHAIGGSINGVPVGMLSDVSTFSFHPVKHMTTAEGGMAVTNSSQRAAAMRQFRNHGIDSDHRKRETMGIFGYDMTELGYNYRLADLNCALGITQLQKLPFWIIRRNEISEMYRKVFETMDHIQLQNVPNGFAHGNHLFPICIIPEAIGMNRDQVFQHLRSQGIGVNVHYPPVHLMSYYQNRFNTSKGVLPITEDIASRLLSLPMHAGLSDADVMKVIDCIYQLKSL